MSEFKKWYEHFTESYVDLNELSVNTFGTLVWDHQQKKIDKLTSRFPGGVDKIHQDLFDISIVIDKEGEEIYKGIEYAGGGHFGDRILGIRHAYARLVQKIRRYEKCLDQIYLYAKVNHNKPKDYKEVIDQMRNYE